MIDLKGCVDDRINRLAGSGVCWIDRTKKTQNVSGEVRESVPVAL